MATKVFGKRTLADLIQAGSNAKKDEILKALRDELVNEDPDSTDIDMGGKDIVNAHSINAPLGKLMVDQIDFNENELLDEIYRVVTDGMGGFIGIAQGLQKDTNGTFLAGERQIKNIGLPQQDMDAVSTGYGLTVLGYIFLEYTYMVGVNSPYKNTPTVELVQDTDMPDTGPVLNLGPYGYGILVDGEPLVVPCADFYAQIGSIPFTPVGMTSVINPSFFHVNEWGRILRINQTNPAENGIFKVFFKDNLSNYIPPGQPIPFDATYEIVRHLDNISAFASWPGYNWSVMRGQKYGRSRWMIDISYWDVLNYGTPAWNPFIPTQITFKRLTARQLDPVADLGPTPTLAELITKVNEFLTNAVNAGAMLPSLTPPSWL